MALVFEAVVGTFFAAIFLGFARARSRDSERLLIALGLAVAALIYVGFALASDGFASLVDFSDPGSRRGLWRELAGLAGFGFLAWLGGSAGGGRLSTNTAFLILSLGWAAHLVWDLLVHGRPPADYVPGWYPGVCLGFDLMVAFGAFSRYGESTTEER